MGKVGFMVLGGAIAILGLSVLILITILASWINDKMIMHKIKRRNNLNSQLIKAKDIIKGLLSFVDSLGNYSGGIFAKAEQFLKECE